MLRKTYLKNDKPRINCDSTPNSRFQYETPHWELIPFIYLYFLLFHSSPPNSKCYYLEIRLCFRNRGWIFSQYLHIFFTIYTDYFFAIRMTKHLFSLDNFSCFSFLLYTTSLHKKGKKRLKNYFQFLNKI